MQLITFNTLNFRYEAEKNPFKKYRLMGHYKNVTKNIFTKVVISGCFQYFVILQEICPGNIFHTRNMNSDISSFFGEKSVLNFVKSVLKFTGKDTLETGEVFHFLSTYANVYKKPEYIIYIIYLAESLKSPSSAIAGWYLCREDKW